MTQICADSWSEEMPSIEYDQIAEAYARHRGIHPGVLAALCAAAAPDSRVLEVGCGTGNYIAALQAEVGCRCWGVDPSAEMLAQARALETPVRWIQGRGEQLDLDPASFDLLFSVDVIHHVADHAAYYREACRVLAPAGRICTATDSAWIIRHRQPLSTYFPETVPRELARYPRIAALRAHMAAAGLYELEERTVEYSYLLHDVGAYRARAYSALHMISEKAFQRGLARMERDLAQGPIACTPRYTLLWGRKAG
jgi:ubiquinone/menaquinone biosynthesis C-methylase UbiE